MTDKQGRNIEVAPSLLGEALLSVRLCSPEAQRQMQWSLSKYGQLTPVVAFRTDERWELIDGFKRKVAAQALLWPSLRVTVAPVDKTGAKVRLWRCNAGAGLTELEEAWLVRALYREDRLTQPQIGRELGRHKSWVCRRLMLAESLSDAVTASVRLGLLSVTAVRELARLPRGNQEAAAQVVTRRGMTSRQVATFVERVLAVGDDTERQERISEDAQAAALPKGGEKRRTFAEQLVFEALMMRRLSGRLHARLLSRPLASLGVEGAQLAFLELGETHRALMALCQTLAKSMEGRP